MAAPTSVRWRMLGLVVLASFVGYALRTNLSIAGNAMRTDLGLSEVQLGIVLSAFASVYAVFQIPGGVLGEIAGPRRVMTALMVGWGLLTVLTAFVPSSATVPPWAVLGSLVGLRGLLGMLQAPLFPVTQGGVIATWFPPASWALPSGLVNTGMTAGGAAAGPAIAWLVITVGWRASYLVSAPIAFAVAGAWWWYCRDEPKDHPGTNRGELELIAVGRPPSESGGDPRRGLRQVVVNRDILLLTFSYFCVNYVFYLFFNWFFYYLTEVRHLSTQAAGNFTGAQWIVGSVAAPLGGLLCDWLNGRLGIRLGCRLTAMAGLLLMAPMLVVGATTAGPVAAIVLLSIAFGCTQLTDAAYWVAAMAIGGKRAPAATGVLNTGGNVAGGIGALLVPLTATAFGWVVAVGSGAVFAVVGALLWLWIRADRPMRAPDPAGASG